MRRVVIISLFWLFNWAIGFATDYGNEWINYSQRYFKIPVARTDIYKLDYTWLQSQGVPVDQIDPRNLQIWRRGEQYSIQVEGQDDGVFNTSDFVMFYGERRDGKTEQDFYMDPSYKAHDYYSVFADTSYYFLTWNANLGNRLPEVAGTSVNAENYLLGERLLLDTSNYSFGWERLSFIYLSEYDRGEGYFSNVIKNGQSYSRSFDNLEFISGTSGEVRLEINVVGRNNLLHKIQVEVGETSPQIFEFDGFFNSQVLDTVIVINESQIQNDKLVVKVKPLGVDGQADAVSVGFFKLTYPKTLTVNSRNKWKSKSNVSGLYTLTDAENINTVLDISDPSNVQDFQFVMSANSVDIAVDQADVSLFLCNTNEARTPLYAKEIQFEDYLSQDFNYIILSNEFFAPVLPEYSNYRSSAEGGSFKVLTLFESALNDQFGFGERNPLAVRKFFKYLIDNGKKPDYFFIIGNGAVPTIQQGSKPYLRFLDDLAENEDGVNQYGNINYVYTYGNPGSDILFTAGIEDNTGEPAVPTGRIGIRNHTQFANYLDKLIEYEAQGQNAEYRKNLLHLSGGANQNEAVFFLNTMNSWALDAQKEVFGGVTETYTKKTTDEVEFINIAEPVNEGIGLMTFLGHSSPNLIEIDVGNVSDVNSGIDNPGKYPIMFLNGCQGGDVFNNLSVLEDWLFSTYKKGSIIGLGHSSYAYSNTLISYTNEFYENKFNSPLLYTMPMGDVQKEVINEILKTPFQDWSIYTQATQFMFYGDPAIKYFTPEKPDFTIKSEEIRIFPVDFSKPLTALSKEYQLVVPVINQGKAIPDDLSVCVTHVYKNGELRKTYGPYDLADLYYRDTLAIVLPAGDINLVGENYYIITIDCEELIDEIDETNNQANFVYNFTAEGVLNVLPANFSIVGSSSLDFVFHPYSIYEDEEEIQFQLDTSALFTSLITDITRSGGLVSIEDFDLPIVQDSTVYYWRTRMNGSDEWSEFSFTYIENEAGWIQSNLAQYDKNLVLNLEISEDFKVINYAPSKTFIEYGSAGNQVEDFFRKVFVRANDQVIIPTANKNRCENNALFTVAFDRNTGLPYKPAGSFGRVCGVEPRIAYSYSALNGSSQQGQLQSYLSAVEKGGFVLIVTSGDAKIEQMRGNQSLMDTLYTYGANLIDLVNNGEAYVLLGQRGNSTALLELKGQDASELLEGSYDLEVLESYGLFQTGFIGPYAQWGDLNLNWSQNNNDTIVFTIKTLDNTGNEISTIQANNFTFNYNLDSLYNVDPFYQLQLEAEFTDAADKIVSDLNYWSVSASDIPESIIVPDVSSLIFELEEGEEWSLNYDIINLSRVDFNDSVLVTYEWYSFDNDSSWVDSLYFEPIEAKKSISSVLLRNTLGLNGRYDLKVFVNPYHQPEVEYSNNILQISLNVLGDNLAPITQVFFDDRVLPTRSIVSPNPVIRIELTDDNRFSFIKDTSSLSIKLFKGDLSSGLTEVPLDWSSLDLKIIEGGELNPFSVSFQPLLEDGFYTLVVSAEDINGNQMDNESLTVFQVVTQRSIVLHSPYPNPSSNDVYFSMTVLGEKLPDNLEVVIYNSVGNRVMSFTQTDFSSWRIGERQILLQWTPALYSDFSNGLYLYNIRLSLEEEVVEKSGTLLFSR